MTGQSVKTLITIDIITKVCYYKSKYIYNATNGELLRQVHTARDAIALRFCLGEHTTTTSIRQRKQVTMSFTTLFFDRDIDTPLMRDIEATWCRISHTGASHAAYTCDRIYVCYAPDGVSVQFGRRLVEIPLEMKTYPPKKIRVQTSKQGLTAKPGLYQGKGDSKLVCDSSVSYPQGRDPYTTFLITVEGSNLEDVNRLMDDFLGNHIAEVTFADVKHLIADKAHSLLTRGRKKASETRLALLVKTS